MLTIFAIPKAFSGHYDVIQRNAIKSWLELCPKCEIILLGNEKGTAETAAELNIKHIPDVKCSKFGTPLVPDVFEKATKAAHYRILAYLNSDIILMNDFMSAFLKIQKPLFLMGGQRIDVEIREPIRFEKADWEQKLRNFVKKHGKLRGPTGIDYFVFPSGIPFNFPANFAAGRPGGDDWTVYRARFLRIPVINTTPMVTAVHQNHGHSYLQGPKGLWEGPESKENQRLTGGHSYIFTLNDADWILTKNGFEKPKLTVRRLSRYFETLPVLYPGIGSWPRIISLILQPRRLAGVILRKLKIIK